MADTANSVIKSKFIARYGPMRAGFGVKNEDRVNASNNNRFWSDIDGTQRPINTMNVITVTTTPYAIKAVDSGAKIVLNSTTSLVANLPPAAVGLEYEVFVKVAASSGLGHILHQPAGIQMYSKGLTSTAGKGVTNTQATGAVGDGVYVWSDGTDWFSFVDAGTWAREA